ncbi:BON1-associated protein 2-like [Humulus lupulus]|uniref:BON1-associated protein 2-like n=1 Tax=Humulus lupulus TaxID=3486 RepID=UPI002B417088|nr:BON1-associated protein 2-like [Humulus lupulus]
MAKSYSSSPAIEITVLSGENLRIDLKSIKKNAFVVVRSNSRNVFRKTEIDTEGGSNPNWNEKLVLDLPVHAAALTVEVHCRTAIGNRLVGMASVPISDISGGYVPESYLHFLSYRLRDQKGERNGIINLSVKTKFAAAPERSCAASSASLASSPVVGVPVGKNNLGGVVTGFPVWSVSH